MRIDRSVDAETCGNCGALIVFYRDDNDIDMEPPGWMHYNFADPHRVCSAKDLGRSPDLGLVAEPAEPQVTV
jgi:hypothetical protein